MEASTAFLLLSMAVSEDIFSKAREQQKGNRKLCGQSYRKDYFDYIYVDVQGVIVTSNYVSSHFHVVLEKGCMKMICFHDLRHSCASLLLAHGVPIKKSKRPPNYSTTANIYTHLNVSSKQNMLPLPILNIGFTHQIAQNSLDFSFRITSKPRGNGLCRDSW